MSVIASEGMVYTLKIVSKFVFPFLHFCKIYIIRSSTIRCNILIRLHFKEHIRGVCKLNTHLFIPLGCTVYNLEWTVETRGCSRMGLVFTFAPLRCWNKFCKWECYTGYQNQYLPPANEVFTVCSQRGSPYDSYPWCIGPHCPGPTPGHQTWDPPPYPLKHQI